MRTCPVCGEDVEFFSYETEAECSSCGRTLHREVTPHASVGVNTHQNASPTYWKESS